MLGGVFGENGETERKLGGMERKRRKFSTSGGKKSGGKTGGKELKMEVKQFLSANISFIIFLQFLRQKIFYYFF